MIYYSDTTEAIEKELSSNFKTGLSDEQVKHNLDIFGKNELQAKKSKSFLERFIGQMKNAMVIILIIAAAISTVVAFFSEEGDFLDPIIIVAIVILNAILGVVQESKAEKALDALKRMSAPNSKVIRNGETKIISSSELVPGDIILLEAGDFVPADARLFESMSLKCEESALTGESLPAEKDYKAVVVESAPLGDRINMVYQSSAVTYGRGKAVVVATGMNTEVGKIAGMLNSEVKEETPLQKRLEQLSKYLGYIALGICFIIFVVGIIMKLDIMEMFITAVSLAVAAIPEGLPAIVTIILAMGVTKMVKQNAIIRRLPAVETLGSTSIICSDKTGTLTQNRMTLTNVWCGTGDVIEVTANLPSDANTVLRLATLCCDGEVRYVDGQEVHVGDPTETAIVAAAIRNGIKKEDLQVEFPRMAEIPFDSDRKLMTTVNMIDGRPVAICKGAFDMLVARCVPKDYELARLMNESLAKSALRVIAVAYKELDEVPSNPTSEVLENELKFVGLLGMIDPPRPEAKLAVQTCVKAGIKTIMITGDHVITASAIARELGILKDGDKAITGAELSELSEEELIANIRKYSVYARVTPSDKLRIVKAWQANGEIVSMTGDGVNDAPALKVADIGCAMGITGTDVAKGAADMVLTDDNFATIVVSVKHGRTIYDNIKKTIQFLLSANLGEVLTVFVAILAGWGTPLKAIQLLMVNLVTDSLPAMALGLEPSEKDIMEKKPKPKNESFFAHGVLADIIWQGLMIGVLTLIAYYIGKYGSGLHSEIMGQSMAFMVLSVSQLFHSFNVKSSRSLFTSGILTNKYLVGAFFASLAIVLVVAFIPAVGNVFGVVKLNGSQWITIGLLSFAPIVICEIVKFFKFIFKKR